MSALAILIGLFAIAVVVHALRSCMLMLYAWSRPERLDATAGPETFIRPQTRFTVLLPARDEAAVIGQTIQNIWNARYPRALLELVVICQSDDEATIEAAGAVIAQIASPRARLVEYHEPPFNKPHALNTGLANSRHEVVAVFDAEDDVSPEIFNVINTVMVQEQVGVVQAGVQLINLRDHWFSVFNCVEYYLHYKSRLHHYANRGVIPLGGNTVFFDRTLLEEVEGWDNRCLTEDADVGMRLSALGHRIRAVYDRRWVTREETPPTVRSFVKQRTRWHQGFLQILGRGDWRRIPGWRRRSLAFFTLAQPILDALLLCVGLCTPLALIYLNLPVLVALLTCIPLYAIALQLLTNITAAVVFAEEYGIEIPRWLLARMVVTYPLYQALIAFAALRASVRHALSRGEWEKTEHAGAHRAPRYAELPVLGPALAPSAAWDSAEERAAQEAVA